MKGMMSKEDVLATRLTTWEHYYDNDFKAGFFTGKVWADIENCRVKAKCRACGETINRNDLCIVGKFELGHGTPTRCRLHFDDCDGTMEKDSGWRCYNDFERDTESESY